MEVPLKAGPSSTARQTHSDEEEDDIPDVAECGRLCDSFASITQTNTALAQSILQDCHWNLEMSLGVFYEARAKEQQQGSSLDDDERPLNGRGDPASCTSRIPRLRKRPQNGSPVDCITIDSPAMASSSHSEGPADVGADAIPALFKVISWNLDGLDHEGLKNRTAAACSEIREKCPDVVFVQELVTETVEYFRNMLATDYLIYAAGAVEYFTAIFLLKSTMQCEEDAILSFPGSRMGRNLLIIKGNYKGLPLTLMTAHLESTKDFAKERQNQLRTCFAQMLAGEPDRTVIFGGDLNLRESDVKAAGGVPQSITDLWVGTGARKECECTWDTKRNLNVVAKVGGGGFNGRYTVCRFDRLYFRPSEHSCLLAPVHFNLVGLKKVPNSQRFPSDHWGIMCTFEKLQPQHVIEL